MWRITKTVLVTPINTYTETRGCCSIYHPVPGVLGIDESELEGMRGALATTTTTTSTPAKILVLVRNEAMHHLVESETYTSNNGVTGRQTRINSADGKTSHIYESDIL